MLQIIIINIIIIIIIIIVGFIYVYFLVGRNFIFVALNVKDSHCRQVVNFWIRNYI
jgi:hypothetical protein